MYNSGDHQKGDSMKKTLLLTVLFLVLVSSGGCMFASMNTLYQPAVGVSQTILPEYNAYVQADPKLSDMDKTIRLNNSLSFQKLVTEYGQ